ncbi:hypothetical protein Tcan_01949 [Toxocara canis]|uniref:Uncharacterized protein n=1 Tax=Toxocara canis TaxID=6265 RepID=A0A0B2UNT7_TOXCA|nr:hypothetical protein Tcan_01949 [Toxocara canis]
MLCFVSNCSAYLFDLADNTIIGIGAKTAEEWRFQTLGSVLGAYLFDLADNTIIGIGAKTAEEWRFQTLGSVLGFTAFTLWTIAKSNSSGGPHSSTS